MNSTPLLAASVEIDWNTILLALIAVLGTAVSGTLAYFMTKLTASAKTAGEKAEAAKVVAEKTAVTVEKVHVAVNSERTAMLAKLQELRLEILGISKDNVVLTDKLAEKVFEKRVTDGVEEADKSREKVVVVLPPEPTPVVIPAEPADKPPTLPKPPTPLKPK